MQKGSAQLLVVILSLILAIIGIYYYQSSKGNNSLKESSFTNSIQQVVSNIKDYSNSLGFQFKYSKDLIAKEDTEEQFNKRGGGDFRKNFQGYVQYEPGKFLAAVVVLGKDNNFDTNPLTLWIFDNPNDLSIDAWYKNYWYYPFVWGDFTYTGKFTLAPNTEATVSGQMAKSGIIDYQPGKPKFVYLRSKELVHLSKDEQSSRPSGTKKMYLFRIIGEEGDKILSTFKFN